PPTLAIACCPLAACASHLPPYSARMLWCLLQRLKLPTFLLKERWSGARPGAFCLLKTCPIIQWHFAASLAQRVFSCSCEWQESGLLPKPVTAIIITTARPTSASCLGCGSRARPGDSLPPRKTKSI